MSQPEVHLVTRSAVQLPRHKHLVFVHGHSVAQKVGAMTSMQVRPSSCASVVDGDDAE